ncbi:MAG: glycosyltransferase, partial [Thermodesulfobacteriota bacterium]|nr:glycosyltransferase [Thermodesulfobacteriota bacterium]
MERHEENPKGVTKADVVVGIPSYNEAATIVYPAQQAALGLRQYFPNVDSVIINCDNFSPDGTKDAFMNADTHGIPKMYLSTPKGVRGKGNNFRNLFKKALDLKAKAI